MLTESCVMVFSPSRAVLSAILRDEYLTAGTDAKLFNFEQWYLLSLTLKQEQCLNNIKYRDETTYAVFLNYCYGYWTILCDHWASYWTSHTGKWSLNCTYRKMKTESMISLSTKISQFSIHKWFLRVQRLQRIRPKQTTKKLAPFLILDYFRSTFFTAPKLRETQNTIGRSVLVISVYFPVGVSIT